MLHEEADPMPSGIADDGRLAGCRFNYMDGEELKAFLSELAEELGDSQITNDTNPPW